MAFTNLATSAILSGKQVNSGPLSVGIPYLKFAWTVDIVNIDGFNLKTPLVAKTCELPRWSITTEVVNVYNHKTLVQTKFNYEPIAISFYDQANNFVENRIWDYVANNFDANDGSKQAKLTPLKIIITMKSLAGDGSADRTYTLGNAYITDAQHDTADYASSEPVLWTITVRYETLDTEMYAKPPKTIATGIASAPKPVLRQIALASDVSADVLEDWKNDPLDKKAADDMLARMQASTNTAKPATTAWPDGLKKSTLTGVYKDNAGNTYGLQKGPALERYLAGTPTGPSGLPKPIQPATVVNPSAGINTPKVAPAVQPSQPSTAAEDAPVTKQLAASEAKTDPLLEANAASVRAADPGQAQKNEANIQAAREQQAILSGGSSTIVGSRRGTSYAT